VIRGHHTSGLETAGRIFAQAGETSVPRAKYYQSHDEYLSVPRSTLSGARAWDSFGEPFDL